MTVRPTPTPAGLQNDVEGVPAETERLGIAGMLAPGGGLTARPGILAAPAGYRGEVTFSVAASTLTVAPFRAVIAATQAARQGDYTVLNDAPVVVTIGGPHPTLGRIDLLVTYVRDTSYLPNEGTDDVVGPVLLRGTPDPTPTPPALPPNVLLHGTVTVPASGTGPITWAPTAQPLTVALGGIRPVDAAQLAEPGLYPGEPRYTAAGLELWNPTATPPAWQASGGGSWTTAGRPTSPTPFQLGRNTTLNAYEFWNATATPPAWEQLRTGGGGTVITYDVQEFTTAGTATWTKPVGAVRVRAVIQGGGGGGGGGATTTPGYGSGAGGGAGGHREEWAATASTLPATLPVTVGAGGAGGVPGGSGGATGGTNGAASSFAGVDAGGGAANNGTTGGSVAVTNQPAFLGGAGGNGTTTNGIAGYRGGAAGGGGGGGGGAANNAGSPSGPYGGGSALTGTARTPAGASAPPPPVGIYSGAGGGGGSAAPSAATSGGAGGAGIYGGGGGGGGGAYTATGNTGGAGGRGGDGVVAVITECVQALPDLTVPNAPYPNTKWDVQTYATAGAFTWTKPAGALYAEVIVQGAGAGGSAAGNSAASTAWGGAGGGGGAREQTSIAASLLPATVAGTVGAGGAGSTAQNVAGGAGGNSTFSTLTALGAPTSAINNNVSDGAAGTYPGAGTVVNPSYSTGMPGLRAPGAGSGGRGASGSGNATATGGGAGGASYGSDGAGLGAAASNTAVAPGGNATAPTFGYSGGGGGGGGSYNYSSTIGAVGGKGGDGIYGGGGGGGGVGYSTGGAGGKGGDGVVLVRTLVVTNVGAAPGGVPAIAATEKATPNGVATLDADGRLPAAQAPSQIAHRTSTQTVTSTAPTADAALTLPVTPGTYTVELDLICRASAASMVQSAYYAGTAAYTTGAGYYEGTGMTSGTVIAAGGMIAGTAPSLVSRTSAGRWTFSQSITVTAAGTFTVMHTIATGYTNDLLAGSRLRLTRIA